MDQQRPWLVILTANDGSSRCQVVVAWDAKGAVDIAAANIFWKGSELILKQRVAVFELYDPVHFELGYDREISKVDG